MTTTLGGAGMALQLLEGRAYNAAVLLVAVASLVASTMQVVIGLRTLRNGRSRPRHRRTIRTLPSPAAPRWPAAGPAMAAATLCGAAISIPIAMPPSPDAAEICAAKVTSGSSAAISMTPALAGHVTVSGHGLPTNTVIELLTRPVNGRHISTMGHHRTYAATRPDGSFATTLPIPETMRWCVYVSTPGDHRIAAASLLPAGPS